MSTPEIQLDFCNADAANRLSAIENRLRELGVTPDLLLSGVVDVRILAAKIVEKVVATYTDTERQILYLSREGKGGTIHEISVQLGISDDEVTRVMRMFQLSMKTELARIFKPKARVLEKSIYTGIDEAMLGTTPVPNAREAR